MNLKQVTCTSQSKTKTAPTISLGYFNGRIYFNAPTSEMLKLKEDDFIAFFRDEDHPHDWFFTKSDLEGSLQLKLKGTALCTFNSGIARTILREAQCNDSENFFIKKVHGEYWKILLDKKVK